MKHSGTTSGSATVVTLLAVLLMMSLVITGSVSSEPTRTQTSVGSETAENGNTAGLEFPARHASAPNSALTLDFSDMYVEWLNPDQNWVDVDDIFLTVEFSLDVDSNGVDGDNYIVHGSFDGLVDGVAASDIYFPNLASFEQTYTLFPGELVTAVLTEDIRSVEGYSLNPWVYQFVAEVSDESFGTFEEDTVLSACDGPFSVCAGDFNGDRVMDLAVAGFGADSVTVKLGDGYGGYSTASTFVTGDAPWAVCAADFDLDGDLDLATSNYGANTVTLHLNQGSGTFATPATTISAGTEPHGLVACDFNADGWMDLATADYDSDSMSVLLNNGQGGFLTRVAYATANMPIGLAAADSDNDGDIDIAVACLSGAVSLFLNDGAGGFGAGAAASYSAGSGASSVVMVDLTGDHSVDMAVCSRYSGDVSVLPNNGYGTFDDSGTPLDVVGQPYIICAGDFDGDGAIDLATCNMNYDNVSVLLNNNGSVGTFGGHVEYDAGDMPVWITTADMDGDARLDLITANATDDNVSILLNAFVGVQLVSPVNGYSTFSHAITLRWLEFDGATSYTVEIDNDGVFGAGLGTTTFSGINDTCWTITPQLGHGTYYWRVLAVGPDLYSETWHFTILNDELPSCPVLYAHNGAQFVEENPLLTACEAGGYTRAVTDYYHVANAAPTSDGRLVFQIRELEDEISFIDNLELVTVDHRTSSSVAVATDGSVCLYDGVRTPVSAVDQDGVDHLAEVTAEDGLLFEATGAGYLTVTFAQEGKAEEPLRIGSGHKQCPLFPKSGSSGLQAVAPNSGVSVAFLTENGSWLDGPTVPVRTHAVEEIVPVDEAVSTGETITVRIYWKDGYSTDVVSRLVATDEEPTLRRHGVTGHELASPKEAGKCFGSFSGGEQLKLVRGDVFEFSFDVTEPLGAGTARDYVIMAAGRYQPDYGVYGGLLPGQYQLYDNYPNPFNPSTTVSFDLPVATETKVEVLNVLGQRVTTLTQGFLEAGHHQVIWNGSDDSGASVASGVYFYRLVTDDFTETRKMMLVK